MMCVWILESDLSVWPFYEKALANYATRFLDSIASLRKALQEKPAPSLLLSEIKLKDGLLPDEGLAKDIFPGPEKPPVLVVSSVDDLDMMRKCFDWGVSDYLMKPVIPAELVVKVERSLGMISPARVTEIAEPWWLEPVPMRVQTRAGMGCFLTSKEYQMLALFQGSAGKPVHRDLLAAQVWRDTLVGAKTLDVHMSKLRKKLKSVGLFIRLESGEGGGYLLAPAEDFASLVKR